MKNRSIWIAVALVFSPRFRFSRQIRPSRCGWGAG